jgi:hypothetical protein
VRVSAKQVKCINKRPPEDSHQSVRDIDREVKSRRWKLTKTGSIPRIGSVC